MFELILIILEQVLIYLPLIAGAYLSFALMKIPNLSIEAAYITGAIFAYKALEIGVTSNANLIFILAVTASIFGGFFVGLIVHLIQSECKIPHLLSNILALGIFYGTNLYLLGGGNKSLSCFINPLLYLNVFKTHPEFVGLASVGCATLIAIFFLLKTQIGYCLAIYGNNPDFFNNYKISQKFITFFGIGVSNALAGISGYLSAQTNGFVDINAGQGISLFCLTALILGKSLFKSKTAINPMIPLLGLISYCSLQQLLVTVGFNLKYFTLIQSLIVLGILTKKYHTQDNSKSTDILGI